MIYCVKRSIDPFSTNEPLLYRRFSDVFRRYRGGTMVENGSRLRQFDPLSSRFRSSPSEVFFGKSVSKICRKFTGEHQCRSVISIKLLCNFIQIALRHGCSPVNLLHIFRTPFPKNTSRGMLLRVFPDFCPF